MEKAGGHIKRAKDLEVYKRAYVVSLDVHKATLAFPKMEQYALADQLRRSSKGICANLAEGFAKQTHSKPEFARFISMAMGHAAKWRRGFPKRSTLDTSARHNTTIGCDPMPISTAC
ncbi:MULTISPECIES: four helix bundle protein [Mesorhizobium]|uniref:four helix bundle protein n=1 Tax=Mesorhizobium TaxID=68287 RepID=UPI001CCF0A49|nr:MULTISPECIES: four helix bundle protein [Mesorhizobium]MBZ9716957.1 four helix bundle protein [Mesorhizobium sp. AD1-1]MDF3209453.1 four helix bundle protein [Mesorhizobium sp. LMG15046]MDF3234118.1 four helix bundle protein [Mesorhizobium sp. DSM 30133]